MLQLLACRGDLVLLRDSVEWEGRSLLKALIREVALKGEQVHVLGCEVSEEAFREGLDSDTNLRLVYHDVFRDPQGWAGNGGPLGALRACLRGADPGPCTLAVDSLSWLLLHAPCSALCQALKALGRGSARPGQVRVLGLLHEDVHGPGPLGALGSLAQVDVTVGGGSGYATARVLHPKPRHRPIEQNHWFSILPDFSLHFLREPPVEAQLHRRPPSPTKDVMADLTFNVHLSKKEREARDTLALPFQFSSEKQQSLLRPAPASSTSQIFYEPDAEDYLDQEDPDNDLDI
ncbi:elongator complex protein 5 [Trichosurus vulpecula]|uniref:elongator complex protein 5 n=1 Tax=Trichosurus vulpecula TaxID=9337 RepID=UPI00186ABDC5|nr:elongator complex protein 5 [Trichosurus vulpecula]